MQPIAHKKKTSFFRIRKEDRALYVMALPTIIFLIIFCYLPMLGLVMAFQEFNITKGILGSPFIGFKNFEFLFTTTDAFVITRNTVVYNLVFIAVNMLLAVGVSLMLSELHGRRTAKTLQTIYMLPYFLSWAVVSIVLTAFLDRQYGLVNQMHKALGLSHRTDWYRQPSIWPGLLVFLNAWKNVGYQSVLYLAVISGISGEFYEAAVLDGATKLQQARYITLPHMRFIIGISIILAMGNIFRGDFGLFYVVTKNTGRLYGVTDVIDTYIYRGLTQLSNVGMSTAAGLYQSVVGLVITLAVNAIVNRIDPDSAMF
ncbi:MAG: ABC transporter permease [Christensenellales bacterium]|jgi:putative aldouronate transport system permease protein